MLDDVAVVREVGFAGRRALTTPRADGAPDRLIRLDPRSLLHPFWIRPGTTDASEFVHTICRRTYDHHLPSNARWILDLGANIGDTAAWFLSRYPDSTVIAVEPDPDNHAVASRNLAPYGARAVLVHAAVWVADGEVSLYANAQWRSGSRVAGGVEGAVRCRAVSIPALLREHAVPHIDILKCDIEGAEQPLFAESPDEWLRLTRQLSIELHSDECAATVRAAAARCGLTAADRHRDVWFFYRGA